MRNGSLWINVKEVISHSNKKRLQLKPFINASESKQSNATMYPRCKFIVYYNNVFFLSIFPCEFDDQLMSTNFHRFVITWIRKGLELHTDFQIEVSFAKWTWSCSFQHAQRWNSRPVISVRIYTKWEYWSSQNMSRPLTIFDLANNFYSSGVQKVGWCYTQIWAFNLNLKPWLLKIEKLVLALSTQGLMIWDVTMGIVI